MTEAENSGGGSFERTCIVGFFDLCGRELVVLGMEMIFIFWAITTAIVLSRLDFDRRNKLERIVMDVAWGAYLPIKAVKAITAVIMIVLSPYFTFLIITKPLRRKSS